MFEVGKKVIAVADSKHGKHFKKGDVFELWSIRKAPCGCGIDLDIGLIMSAIYLRCSCGYREASKTMWVASKSFKPYDDTLSTITADELIEQLEFQAV